MKKDIFTIFTIFGVTGDLAEKKIIPSFFSLYRRGILNKNNFVFVCSSRRDWSDSEYRYFVRNILEKENFNSNLIDDFLDKVFYIKGDLEEQTGYDNLFKYIKKKENDVKRRTNRLFYLAIPPVFYNSVFNNLYKNKLIISKNNNHKLLIEKPFGNDLKSSIKLDNILKNYFSEKQILKVDHYLGKEVYQDILNFKKEDKFLNKIWNDEYISKISIKLYESFDISGREEFYSKTGAFIDVGQNHLLQILSLLFLKNKNNISRQKTKILSKIIPKKVLFAQYENFSNQVKKEDSNVETYFDVDFYYNSKKWKKTKINLISGKSLSKNLGEIKIIFSDYGYIIFQTKPENKIEIKLNINEFKKTYSYKYPVDIFDAYERIIYSAIISDYSYFSKNTEIFEQWKITQKVFDMWDNKRVINYKQGENPKNINNIK